MESDDESQLAGSDARDVRLLPGTLSHNKANYKSVVGKLAMMHWLSCCARIAGWHPARNSKVADCRPNSEFLNNSRFQSSRMPGLLCDVLHTANKIFIAIAPKGAWTTVHTDFLFAQMLASMALWAEMPGLLSTIRFAQAFSPHCVQA